MTDADRAARRSAPRRPAGIVTRAGAAVVDLGLLLLLGALGYLGLAGASFVFAPRSFSWPELSLVAVLVVEGTLAIAYLTAGWAVTGRTLGKTLLGLRVLSRNGRLLGWTRALLRAIACVVFPIGLLWVVLSPHRRSLQDIVLRTMVIYDWRNTADPAPAVPDA